MILAPKILARIAALCLAAILLQVSFFSRVEVLGVSPHVAVLVVIVLGLLGGVLVGAVAGFGVGIVIDALIAAPLGSTALAFILAGYLAGLYRERSRREAGRLAIPAVAMGLTLAAELALFGVHLMIGLSGPFSTLLIRDILVGALYAFLLGMPVYLGTRLVLRPALIEEAPFERGRATRSRAGVLET